MQAPDPARIASKVEDWFSRHQRPLPWRASYDPYHVWVSEVMLQQTRMEVVLGYFERFLARFPTLAALAASSEEDVMAAWSGLGYYRRARMLREGAREVVARFDGVIPRDVTALLTVPGIGRYTAGAIASVAHDARAPIVDGNVARIVARLFAIEEVPITAAFWQRATELVNASHSPRAFNQGLMELGALVCKPRNPSCLLCPLSDVCVARNTGRIDELPRAKEKPATRELRIPLYVVVDRNGRVLMRRESGKLMTSMYHLPHGDTSLLGGTPLTVRRKTLLGTVRHTVTTRRIEFEVWRAELDDRVRDSAEEYAWIDVSDLSAVPHPSYVRKALRLITRTGA